MGKALGYTWKIDKDRTKFHYVSIQGILVNNESILPRWLHYGKVYSDIDFKSGSIGLDLSRTRIVHDERLRLLLKKMNQKILRRLDHLIKNWIGQNNFDYKIVNKFMEGYIDLSVLYQSEYEHENAYMYDKIFRDDSLNEEAKKFLKHHYKIRCLHNGKQLILTCEEAVKYKNKELILLPESDEYIGHFSKECNSIQDDHLYVISTATPKWYVNRMIGEFLNIGIKEHYDFLKYEKMSEFSGMLSNTFRLVKFINYRSKYILELAKNKVLINADHRFIQLLLKKKTYNEFEKSIFKSFFVNLRKNLKVDPKHLIVQQQTLLSILVKDGIIKKDEMQKYTLNKDDFSSLFRYRWF